MRGSPRSGFRKHKAVPRMEGNRFGRLVVTRFRGYDRQNGLMWECRCDCGNVITTRSDRLKRGCAKSCGCITKERIAKVGHANRKHGLCGSSIYRRWSLVLQRCLNPQNPAYPSYGGRGIRVCESIRSSAQNLLTILGPQPAGTTIDRENNDGGYTCGSCTECIAQGWPRNVRWATASQQARNKRTSIRVQDGNKIVALADFAESRGLRPETVWRRMRSGWPLSRLGEPIL